METKTVKNIEELTVYVLSSLAELFKSGLGLYEYTIDLKGNIRISTEEGGYVLGINHDSIEVRDIINDALLDTLSEFEVEERKKQYAGYTEVVSSVVDAMNDPHMSSMISSLTKNQYESLIGEPVKHVTYKTFKFFKTEEEWFQQMTIQEDVLPFECLSDIQKIKDLVLKDLAVKWTMD